MEKLKRRSEAPAGKGTKFLGNWNKHKYHDLDKEVAPCQIDMMAEKHMRHFPTKASAEDAGYDPCDWCVLDLGAKNKLPKI